MRNVAVSQSLPRPIIHSALYVGTDDSSFSEANAQRRKKSSENRVPHALSVTLLRTTQGRRSLHKTQDYETPFDP
jgi:hypothetical protein